MLTVCWETLVLQNPTLMVFYMRLYICGVKSPCRGHACELLREFSSHSFTCKGLRARGFPDWEGGFFFFFFLRSEALWTLRERQRPFRPMAPSWNIMFVYLWREFILLIHWLALLQRLKEFDFLFIYSLHFSSCGRVVSCVIPQENFLPPCFGPLRNEIRERKGNGR